MSWPWASTVPLIVELELHPAMRERETEKAGVCENVSELVQCTMLQVLSGARDFWLKYLLEGYVRRTAWLDLPRSL